MTEPPDDAARPLLRVVRGDATPEEVAALVAVLAARAGAPAPAARPRGQWAHPVRSLRVPTSAAPGGWRASSLP